VLEVKESIPCVELEIVEITLLVDEETAKVTVVGFVEAGEVETVVELEPVETTELVTGTDVETTELDNVIGLEPVETTELVTGTDVIAILIGIINFVRNLTKSIVKYV